MSGFRYENNKYREYLLSKVWRVKAKIAKLCAAHRCEVCGSKIGLCIHHYNYDNLFNEKDSDLFVLCKQCHTNYHKEVEKLPKDELTRAERLNEIKNALKKA